MATQNQDGNDGLRFRYMLRPFFLNRKTTAIFLISSILIVFIAAGCSRKDDRQKRAGKKVIVLGFDGMDPRITADMLERGELPNIAKLAAVNKDFKLGTSFPPQSPVAWSDFISGTNPGSHGIFDFIQRDPETYLPEFSMSEAYGPKHTLRLGNAAIPLGRSGMRLLRKGEAFWNALEDAGVPCAVFRVPSNFPPQKSEAKTFAGMGTPDLRGGYGSFSFFTDDRSIKTDSITGGTVTFINSSSGKFASSIAGPDNTFIKGAPAAKVSFTVSIDKKRRAAVVDIQNQRIALAQGEWSGWTPLSFTIVKGLAHSRGMVLFYLKEVSPHFKLYVSPVNIDPASPDVPLSTPDDYSSHLAQNFGRFYTAGMPEDTKAFDHGIFTDKEYIRQAGIHHAEQKRIFRSMLKETRSGLLFFYFSDTDLGQHMFWSSMDKDHPGHKSRDPRYKNTIFEYYRNMDSVAGEAIKTLGPEDTLIIISDHGFAPFRYSFNLNTWLRSSGYAVLLPGADVENDEYLISVDWSATKAYALGFNSLYVNLSGREKHGIVDPDFDKKPLMDEIRKKLLATVDPKTGEHPVSSVYFAKDIYSGPELKNAPDMIIGYNRGYRGSWETALGKFPEKVIVENTEKWSGDHCIDPKVVPGIIFSNRKIRLKNPALRDVPAGIIQQFGVAIPKWMQGRPLF